VLLTFQNLLPCREKKAVITILLADDHEIFRQGLLMLLSAQPDINVVGQAANGAQALQQAESLHPDVAVIDMLMPDINGMEVTRQIRERLPDTQVVVLSMYSDEGYVINAMRSGACAYVLKESSTADLVQAVRSANAGKRFLSPILVERAIDVYLDQGSKGFGPRDRVRLLTKREREVLDLCLRGFSAAQISEQLGISPRTAEAHRGNLMQKLGVHSQSELLEFMHHDS
jgi:DNA-binding NarL/FixJ family response regulator